jgi:hypothetical protein
MDRSDRTTAFVLFWTFWAIYVLGAIGTLGMLFFGFGSVRDTERPTLTNAFLVETAVAIVALFYSLWRLRRGDKSQDSEGSNDLVAANARLKQEKETLEVEAVKRDALIQTFQSQVARTNRNPPADYHDAIVALCSPNADTEVDDIVRRLFLDPVADRDKVQDVLSEVGRMKRAGDLYVHSQLNPHSVRLSIR